MWGSRCVASALLLIAANAASVARADLCSTDTVYTVLEARMAALCRLDRLAPGCTDFDIDCDGDVDICDIQIITCARGQPISATSCCDETICRACVRTDPTTGAETCEEMTQEQCMVAGGTPGDMDDCPPGEGPLPLDASVPLDDAGVIAVPDAGVPDAALMDAAGVDSGGSTLPPPLEGPGDDFRGKGGCGCSVQSPTSAPWASLLLCVLVAMRRFRR